MEISQYPVPLKKGSVLNSKAFDNKPNIVRNQSWRRKTLHQIANISRGKN